MNDRETFYANLRRPDFIPGYRIRNRLGGGAFGEVYRATKTSIGKPYAIKFLHLDGGAHAGTVERELASMRLFASIDHPNLVSIEDLGVAAGVPYLVMGYAGEQTLARRLERRELGRDAAARFFVQACRGVLALHDRRLAHFDLKPGNIFIKGDVARVGDYGLAMFLVEGERAALVGRGTPVYMAPEMLTGGADHRADIYSLGLILFECLTRELPFELDRERGALVRPADGRPRFPESFPDELRPVVERALRIDPDERHASVHELLEEMGQAARQGDSVRIRWNRLGPPRSEELPAGGAARPPAAREPTSARRSQLLEAVAEARQFRAEEPAPPPVGGTVPVPPRVEGGLFGDAVATVVLGVEVLAALVAVPILLLARAGRSTVERLTLGEPGVRPGLAARGLMALVILVGLAAMVGLCALAAQLLLPA